VLAVQSTVLSDLLFEGMGAFVLFQGLGFAVLALAGSVLII